MRYLGSCGGHNARYSLYQFVCPKVWPGSMPHDPRSRLQLQITCSFCCICRVFSEIPLYYFPFIAVSSGSACTSASLEPSYVLRAIGADEDLAHSSIRFGIGRFTTQQEVDYTAERCIKEVQRLREMSPLWEMYEEGIDIKSIQWTQH